MPSPPPVCSQVLAWGKDAIVKNSVARSLHNLFLALHQVQQHQQGAAAGSAPVVVDPTELRAALAALPNQLFQLGE